MKEEINQELQKEFDRYFTTVIPHINKRMEEIQKRKQEIVKAIDRLDCEFKFLNDEWLRLQTILNSMGKEA